MNQWGYLGQPRMHHPGLPGPFLPLISWWSELFICSFCNADYSTCTRLTFPRAAVLAICYYYYFYYYFFEIMLLTFLLKGIRWHFEFHRTTTPLLQQNVVGTTEGRLFSFSVFNQRNLQNNTKKKGFSLKIQLKLINKPHGRESDKNLL